MTLKRIKTTVSWPSTTDPDQFLASLSAEWRSLAYSYNMHGDHAPEGAIIGCTGLTADCPDGWDVCNGSNGTPDLTGNFVSDGAGGYKLYYIKKS